MQKAHDSAMNTYWRDKPNLSTPIKAQKKNQLETTVDVIDDRVIVLDTTKANQVDLLTCIADVTWSEQTGTLTFIKKNGSSIAIDTDLEKAPINLDFDGNPQSPHYQSFVLTLVDGTVKYIDASAFVTQFEFDDTDTIDFTNTNGRISASVKLGSISEDYIEPTFLADINTAVARSENFSKDSEAWARGTRDDVPVSSTDAQYNNNSKYYADMANGFSNSALQNRNECEEILQEVQHAAGAINFYVDMETGEIIYDNNLDYTFSINATTGNLEWEVVA